MKKSFAAIAGLLLATTATPAFAQDTEEETGPITVSGGVSLVSDYRFRGVSLSGEDFAVQPTITVSHESGFYAGVWGSNLDDTPVYGEVEVDLYAGYNTDIGEGTNLDVGLIYYWYPDGDNAAGPSDYFETIVKLAHDIGPVTATGTVGYSWSQASLGDNDNLYLGLGQLRWSARLAILTARSVRWPRAAIISTGRWARMSRLAPPRWACATSTPTLKRPAFRRRIRCTTPL